MYKAIASGPAVIGLVLCAELAAAQDLSRYRAYALESSLELVATASGSREADVKTLYARPANIQELEWRAPYGRAADEQVDPVRAISFSFYDEVLYQIVVRYDRDRTSGLTSTDIVQSLSTAYGVPALGSAGRLPAGAFQGDIVLAEWEDTASSLTLLRSIESPEYQLILISKGLNMQARTAIREAVRLNAQEAPDRALEQRRKEAAAASAENDKLRTTNKAAFRP